VPLPQVRTASRPEPEEPASPRGDKPVRTYLEEVVKANKVVLFMKGTPDAPSCGFSASAAGILKSYGTPFFAFDVLVDGDVREGVKEFSSWPTLPQVFVNGEFVGGADILKQLHESGELGPMLA
jgi:monothiol glutaredoxin